MAKQTDLLQGTRFGVTGASWSVVMHSWVGGKAFLRVPGVLIGINVPREITRRGLVVAAAFLSFLLLFSFFVEGCGYVENVID